MLRGKWVALDGIALNVRSESRNSDFFRISEWVDDVAGGLALWPTSTAGDAGSAATTPGLAVAATPWTTSRP